MPAASKARAVGINHVALVVVAFFLLIALINLLWWPLVIATVSFAMFIFRRRHTTASYGPGRIQEQAGRG